MGLRLVDDDLEISLNLALNPSVRAAIAIQLQRAVDDSRRSSFEGRLARTLQDLLDADFHPPSYKQLSVDFRRKLSRAFHRKVSHPFVLQVSSGDG